MDVRILVLTNTLLKTLDEPLLGKYDRIVSGVPELYVFSQPKQYNETAASEGFILAGVKFQDLDILFIEAIFDEEDDSHNLETFKSILEQGWDIITIDSFYEL